MMSALVAALKRQERPLTHQDCPFTDGLPIACDRVVCTRCQVRIEHEASEDHKLAEGIREERRCVNSFAYDPYLDDR